MSEESKGFSRRTVVKGAAWSVPVIAAAVATPLASASTAPFNATVTAYCTNDYDLSVLQNILDGIGLGSLMNTVQTALAVIGLTAGATRGFTVTATSGTIPAGTQYLFSDPDALITLSGLESALSAGVAGVVSTTGGYLITTSSDIAQGGSFNVNVYGALADVGVASGFTLAQVQTDSDTTDNSATTNALAAAAVDLSQVGILGTLGVTGTLAVQTCDL